MLINDQPNAGLHNHQQQIRNHEQLFSFGHCAIVGGFILIWILKYSFLIYSSGLVGSCFATLVWYKARDSINVSSYFQCKACSLHIYVKLVHYISMSVLYRQIYLVSSGKEKKRTSRTTHLKPITQFLDILHHSNQHQRMWILLHVSQDLTSSNVGITNMKSNSLHIHIKKKPICGKHCTQRYWGT